MTIFIFQLKCSQNTSLRCLSSQLPSAVSPRVFLVYTVLIILYFHCWYNKLLDTRHLILCTLIYLLFINIAQGTQGLCAPLSVNTAQCTQHAARLHCILHYLSTQCNAHQMLQGWTVSSQNSHIRWSIFMYFCDKTFSETKII